MLRCCCNHRAPRECLYSLEEKERPPSSGTSNRKGIACSEQLADLTEHALQCTSVECIGDGPNISHLFHTDAEPPQTPSFKMLLTFRPCFFPSNTFKCVHSSNTRPYSTSDRNFQENPPVKSLKGARVPPPPSPPGSYADEINKSYDTMNIIIYCC